jgi:TPP-dependent 2-oxoacid decarboxylase
MPDESTTVGDYLIRRLEQVGLEHIFGVAGDYVVDLLGRLEKSDIETVYTCNELNAGYAADAYARIRGVGAVCVTYDVGGLSVVNAVAGAYAERSPVIVISGAPRSTDSQQSNILLHHTAGDLDLQYTIFSEITSAAVKLESPGEAAKQIDTAIASCVRYRQPVYIEVPADIVSRPCGAPGPFEVDTSIPSHKPALEEAVDESAVMLASAGNPVIVAGVETHRLGARRDLLELIEHTGFPFVSTLLGKSVVREQHPQYAGVYCGALSTESARYLVEEADLLLVLGALATDTNLGVGTAKLEIPRMIVANSDKVSIKHHVFNEVGLVDFINGLKARLPAAKVDPSRFISYEKQMEDFQVAPDQPITVKRFFKMANRFLDGEKIVIAETGDSLFNAASMFLPGGVDFIAQAFYLSIGFAIPATLGVGLAAPEKRPVTFVGDGALQMTAQELSTIIREGLTPVIFLLNNDGYTIERMIHEGGFNELNMWKYSLLPEVFNGERGLRVTTEGEMDSALRQAKDDPDSLAFIEVVLDKYDCSDAVRRLGRQLGGRSQSPP